MEQVGLLQEVGNFPELDNPLMGNFPELDDPLFGKPWLLLHKIGTKVHGPTRQF